VDRAGLWREQLEAASPDVLRAMVKMFAEALMSAHADAACGAGYGERSEQRVNSRNGYRAREWDTRAGTVELAIPKLPTGSYFPGLGCCSTAAAPSRPWFRGRDQLLAGGVDSAGGEAGRAARRAAAVQEPGQ
jgi:hypothetical protein